MFAFILIALATLENIWPMIEGIRKTPPDFIFLGTVHHPNDYFYYLSQFAQGADRWITTINLYSSEAIAPTFVGWSNVLTGKLFWLFGLPPLVAYHASVLIFTFLLLIASYKLARHLLGSRFSATVALYLFGLFHAFPIIREGLPSYGDYFNNYAVPRVRFGGVPHQLLLHFSSFILVYALFRSVQGRSWHTTATIVASSIVLASLQPVLWVLVTGVFLSTLILTQKTFRQFFPAIVALGSGVPFLLYLNNLFSTLPFSQLKAWEASQQTALTPEHFLSATGPILIISLLFIPLFLKKRLVGNLFIIVFTVLSFALFLSPVPQVFGLSHVRFMSTLAILFLCIIAAEGLKNTGKQFRLITIGTLTLLTLYLVPNHLHSLSLSTQFTKDNQFHYIHKHEYNLIALAGKMSTPADLFLVVSPFDVLLPAVTARAAYTGHPLLTVNASTKEADSHAFFSGSMPNTSRSEFLKRNRITYIVSYRRQEDLENIPELTKIDQTDMLVLYQVSK